MNSYDADGISGGWAAKELCENKLKVVITKMDGRKNTITEDKTKVEVGMNTEATTHLLVDDFEHPYNEDKR